jgi:hypothetical protein
MVVRKTLLWWLPAATLLSAGLAVAQEEVYRWVDDQGEVHYGATLPPEYAHKPHQILRNGIVIKSIDDPMAPEPTEKEQALQQPAVDPEREARQKQLSQDRLLLLKYHSEEEIIAAMDLELSNLDYDARVIEQTRTNAITALSSQIREAADRQRAGMPVDPETSEQISMLRTRLRQNDQNRTDLQTREAQIREMFMVELRRYRYLMEGGAGGEPSMDATPGTGGP